MGTLCNCIVCLDKSPTPTPMHSGFLPGMQAYQASGRGLHLGLSSLRETLNPSILV